MSKYVKDLITRELSDRFKEVDGVAVINPRGIDATKNNGIRRRLHGKGLRMTVVKNTLARRAVGDGSRIKGFDRLLDGPSAVIYGRASIAEVARFLLEEKKADEKLEMRGIFFDGEAYVGDKGVEQVSKLPTREEAIGRLVTLMLSPGRNLAAALGAPGSALAAALANHPGKKPVETREAASVGAAPNPTGAAPPETLPESGKPLDVVVVNQESHNNQEPHNSSAPAADDTEEEFVGALDPGRRDMKPTSRRFVAWFDSAEDLEHAVAETGGLSDGPRYPVISRRGLMLAVDLPPEHRGDPAFEAALDERRRLLAEQYHATVEEDAVLGFHAGGAAAAPPPKARPDRRHITKLLPDDPASPCVNAVLKAIRADAVPDREVSPRVVIAIVDSGINGDLPEFSGQVRASKDQWAPLPTNPWEDVVGHGTMCASIAAARGERFGRFDGVAPGARLFSARMVNEDQEAGTAYVTGAYEALADYMEANPGDRLIVCNCWGYFGNLTPRQFHTLSARVSDLVGRGAVVLFSAGNEHKLAGGRAEDCHPSLIGELQSRGDVMVVGACHVDDSHVWFYSNRGPGRAAAVAKPDVVAPVPELGRVVYRDGIYRVKHGWGTSGACPQVAGLCALMLTRNEQLDAKQLFKLIRGTAVPLKRKSDGTALSPNCQGAGRIDCAAALGAM